MKNSADVGGCYPPPEEGAFPKPRPRWITPFFDLQNSSYPTQPHSITAKYLILPLNKIKYPFTTGIENVKVTAMMK